LYVLPALNRKKDLSAALCAEDTAMNEKLINLGHIFLGELSALGESVPVVKKMIEVGC